ncbi:murein L,D-transpeptidase catalytic domain family protein [Rhodanobacter aciditrophus]|uniref:murein L,D-transpeptidase catalytic domain family protein n=1 Tax=Rhodanobacter aciditrophus TaxID=1623218 RepID=UPI003CF4D18F
MNPIIRRAALLAALATGACFLSAHAAETPLAAALHQLAPAANPAVIALALQATDCATARGLPPSDRLAVIDYSLPSTEPRLWVFDLAHRKLLFRELVAHGRNSGGDLATRFSNRPDSLESSLGLFRTLGTYDGHNGYSLRMEGLDPGFNNNALERALVIHGAAYVNPALARKEGRIGRSWGCPAVRTAVVHPLIDALKNGQYVFSYYPNPQWLSASRNLQCSPAQTATASLAH